MVAVFLAFKAAEGLWNVDGHWKSQKSSHDVRWQFMRIKSQNQCVCWFFDTISENMDSLNVGDALFGPIANKGFL